MKNTITIKFFNVSFYDVHAGDIQYVYMNQEHLDFIRKNPDVIETVIHNEIEFQVDDEVQGIMFEEEPCFIVKLTNYNTYGFVDKETKSIMLLSENELDADDIAEAVLLPVTLTMFLQLNNN